MAKTVTTRYDVAEHLRTPEEMATYLETCLEEAAGDGAFVAKALGDIARAKDVSQVARDVGLGRFCCGGRPTMRLPLSLTTFATEEHGASRRVGDL